MCKMKRRRLLACLFYHFARSPGIQIRSQKLQGHGKMAWLARSIANSLKLDDDDDGDEVGEKGNLHRDDEKPNTDHDASDGQRTEDDRNTPRGVKEDLSELSKTLRSQLWGVASFLAPPSSDQPEEKALPLGDREASGEEDVISGIRSDFAEIGGRFRTGMSKLSSNIAVTEFTKMASNILQLGSDEEIANAVGVTEEVVAFARDISMHPETWLDFPSPDEDDDFADFDMTDAQQEHALAVERLAPRLAALRIELCPGYMRESCFWKIYFVLLHPKLSKHDALLLSTPQVLEARAMLSNELQRRNKPVSVETESSGTTNPEAPTSMEQPLSVSSNDASKSIPPKTISIETSPAMDPSTSITEKHPVQVTETHTVDKSVVDDIVTNHDKPQNPARDSSKILIVESADDDDDDDDDDDWLKEETSESVSAKVTTIPISNDEDVSFSDFEDDEDEDVPVTRKNATPGSDSSDKNNKPVGDKHGQVSQTKESNDWLDVDDIDVV